MSNWHKVVRLSVCLFLLFSSTILPSQESTMETADDSGNAFLRLCSSLDDPNAKVSADGMACLSYVIGVVQGIDAEIEFVHALGQKRPPRPFCIPTSVENGQKVRIVLKYIHNHPEDANMLTALLIPLALRDAFPCRT